MYYEYKSWFIIWIFIDVSLAIIRDDGLINSPNSSKDPSIDIDWTSMEHER